MQINDENISPFYDANVAKYAGKDSMGGLNKADFTTANLKHAINGRLFCNLEGLTMNTDQKIRWHTAVLVGSPPFSCLCPSPPCAMQSTTTCTCERPSVIDGSNASSYLGNPMRGNSSSKPPSI